MFFYIPRSTCIVQLTYLYCRWWMAFTISYICFSVASVCTGLMHHTFKRRSFVISDLGEISTSLRKVIPLLEASVKNLPPSSPPLG